MSEKTLGQVAYEAWGPGVSFDEEMAEFKDNWERAAKAVLAAIATTHSAHPDWHAAIRAHGAAEERRRIIQDLELREREHRCAMTGEDECFTITKKLRATITPQQQEEQRRSFAFGNTNTANSHVTRAMVDEAARSLAKDAIEQGDLEKK